jgi:immunoglobulin-binding protein 1
MTVDMSLTETLAEIEKVVGVDGTLSGHVAEGPCSLSSLKAFEEQIEHLDMFSKNEEVDDLHVLSLRCLNVPYYLALAYDSQGGEEKKSLLRSKRMALAYYDRFLEQCVEYKVLEPRIHRIVEACIEGEEKEEMHASMLGGSMSREGKIEMFKIERQLKRDMEILQRVSEDEARPIVLMMVNRYVIKALGARHMVGQEVVMLDAAVTMGESEREAHERMMSEKHDDTAMLFDKLKNAVQGLENKRDALRKDVFRPSHILPTYTVEEFGEMEMERMKAEEISRSKKDVVKKREESDDDDDVEKCRAWDDFKDDNPKGWGNSKLRPTG